MTYDPYAPPQHQYPQGNAGPYGLLGAYERFGWKTTATAILIGLSVVGVGIGFMTGLKQAGLAGAATFEDATGNAVVALSLFLSAMAAVAIISLMRQLERRQEALSAATATPGS
jgi:hypothetical protein